MKRAGAVLGSAIFLVVAPGTVAADILVARSHFLTKTIPRVSTEMSLHVLAYNMKRAMQILGIAPLVAAIRA